MRKHILLGLCLLPIVALATGCRITAGEKIRGSGEVITETFAVSGFTAVDLMTVGDLIIEKGTKEQLRVEAEENLIPYLEIEVSGRSLAIACRTNIDLRPTKPLRFHLTVKELHAIELSGSGNIDAPDFDADRFTVRLNGSGNIRIGELTANTIDTQLNGSGNVNIARGRCKEHRLSINGSGDVEIGRLEANVNMIRIPGSGEASIRAGRAERQDITINGSGDYRARRLDSDEAGISISGSGNATIRVNDELSVSIGGSGDVRYAGRPTIEKSISGSGSLRQI